MPRGLFVFTGRHRAEKSKACAAERDGIAVKELVIRKTEGRHGR